MRRRRRTIALFLACAAAVLGAMTWLSSELLALERREAVARSDAAFQETIRISMLRMDSLLALFLTAEARRPYFHYASLYSADQAWTQIYDPVCKGDFQQASPLLQYAEPRFCRLHFQIDPLSGSLTSPRLPPEGAKRGLARDRGFVTGTDVARVSSLIETLTLIAPTPRLIEIARKDAEVDQSQGEEAWQADAGMADDARRDDVAVHPQGPNDLGVGPRAAQRDKTGSQEPAYSKLNAAWFKAGSEWQLILLRTVRIEDEELIQGIWVDWPRLRHALLERIKDRIPDADLEPMTEPGIESDRKLAGIPALLVAKPPRPPAVAAVGVTPTRVTLSVAWAGVIAAVLAIGLVLRAIIDIGERRGRFVSAVTHELRTPLTTFCLYSQMLADNMVKDEPKRREYLATLKRESQRLAKIVENVLHFARLSEVRSSVSNEAADGVEILDRIVPVLSRRAAESGMTLDSDVESARGAVVRADPQTLERILSNLVDNACKYAKDYPQADGKVDNRVHIRAHAAGGVLEIRVTDHGPGIARQNRRRAFRAFNRADDTSNTAPGLGLGLSLARGLARSLRGDLRIVGFGGGGEGAVLLLTIPAEIGVGAGVLARA